MEPIFVDRDAVMLDDMKPKPLKAKISWVFDGVFEPEIGPELGRAL